MRASTRSVVPDDRAALRSLFEAAATQTAPVRRADVSTSRTQPRPVSPDVALLDGATGLRMEFSSARLDGPASGTFSGPAVAPLAVLK